MVDDAVILRSGPTEIFRYDYGANGPPTPVLVVVPESVLLPWAGQSLTVTFQDIYGSLISATPM